MLTPIMVKWNDEDVTFSVIFADLKIKMDVFFAVSSIGEPSMASVRRIPNKILTELFFDQLQSNKEDLSCSYKLSDLWEELGKSSRNLIECDGIGSKLNLVK